MHRSIDRSNCPMMRERETVPFVLFLTPRAFFEWLYPAVAVPPQLVSSSLKQVSALRSRDNNNNKICNFGEKQQQKRTQLWRERVMIGKENSLLFKNPSSSSLAESVVLWEEAQALSLFEQLFSFGFVFCTIHSLMCSMLLVYKIKVLYGSKLWGNKSLQHCPASF